MTIGIVFPHQLFEELPFTKDVKEIWLVEEYLFFKQMPFHKQKIAFHRASMKAYCQLLLTKGYEVHYIEAISEYSDVRLLIAQLGGQYQALEYIDPVDCWLEQRILRSSQECKMVLKKLPTPMFMMSEAWLNAYAQGKKQFFQTDFYKKVRIALDLLMQPDGSPLGGQWTYDQDNRKKYPPQRTPPPPYRPETLPYYLEAIQYTHTHFGHHPGMLAPEALYPTTHDQARAQLQHFLEHGLVDFGNYQDSIVLDAPFLHHSLLSAALNTGLLLPGQVIHAAIGYGLTQEVPLNSLEGFVRQIIGWREYMRLCYVYKGTPMRTRNFWNFDRPLPSGFWDANTGISPLDDTLTKTVRYAYNHHIERLMVLGNFLLLTETHPDEVYKWFMCMYIDAYDWVMVPNVYAMSQYADGGTLTTKPYISGSNYLSKMSNWPKGQWQSLWDALFWRFMHTHRDFFVSNPRLALLVGALDKMDEQTKAQHLRIAEQYLYIR